jgi:hypothetical protein
MHKFRGRSTSLRTLRETARDVQKRRASLKMRIAVRQASSAFLIARKSRQASRFCSG